MDHPRRRAYLPARVGPLHSGRTLRFATPAAGRCIRHVAICADPAVCDRVAREWSAWEDAHVSLAPGHLPNPRHDNPEFRLGSARLVTHYWRHAAFLPDGQLLREASTLKGIPGILIHGRYDV